MIIRDYRQGDFPQIEKLWKETGVYRPERGDTHETILRCNETGGKFLVLEDKNEQIIGTSWLTWDGRRVIIQYVAVLPSMQGKGYGRKLAVEALKCAREKGTPVKLEVHRDNRTAVSLYRELGFEILDGYEVYLAYPGS